MCPYSCREKTLCFSYDIVIGKTKLLGEQEKPEILCMFSSILRHTHHLHCCHSKQATSKLVQCFVLPLDYKNKAFRKEQCALFVPIKLSLWIIIKSLLKRMESLMVSPSSCRKREHPRCVSLLGQYNSEVFKTFPTCPTKCSSDLLTSLKTNFQIGRISTSMALGPHTSCL